MSAEEFTSTANGAVALKSTGNIIVDFFMIFSRTISEENIENYMEQCWKLNPIKTIAIIFNGRDRKNGKKEKLISNKAMIWLRNNKPLSYKGNIDIYIEKYGCWKDIMYINFNYSSDKSKSKLINDNIKNISQDHELKLIANQLIEDKNRLAYNESVSLCAKWAPSENDKYDKRRKSAFKIAQIIFPDEKKIMEKYRKEYITPLRKKINIVETYMCENKWSEINYEQVPAIASNRLKGAFMKHDVEGYKKFLFDVKSGLKSIKVCGILPHELVKYYFDESITEPNETIELQWNTIVNEVKKSGTLDGLLAIVDVSGSMFCASNGSIPAQVAISLGLLISECSSGKFHKKIISFSEEPKFHNVKGDTLFDKIHNIRRIDFGLSTNFEATSDLIIKYGIENNIEQENMPKKLVCLTDMQFNKANNCNKYSSKFSSKSKQDIETHHKYIIKKYEENNYKAPLFIYWNLNSDTNEIFPVSSSEEGTAVISGFSEQLLKVFMKYDKFTPEFIIDEILQPYIKDVYIDNIELHKVEKTCKSTISDMFTSLFNKNNK